jgi:hypothetical protein
VARGPGFPAPAGVIALNLIVSLEPKVRSLEGFTLRLDKVVDDQGQELAPADDPGTVAAVGLARRRTLVSAAGFSTQYLPARLKAGEKPAKALREVRGAVGARLLAEPRPLLAVDDVLNSAGKTFKGDGGGAIRVLEVARDGGGEDRVTLRFEVDLPPDVPGVGEGVVVPGGRIRRVIVPAPAPLPAPGGGAMLPAAPGGVLVVMAGLPPGGPGPAEPAAAPAARRPSTGPSVLDDRGEPLELAAVNRNFRREARGVVREYTLAVQPRAGRKPAKLVFAESKMVNVEIPFTLKDVPLP